MKYIVQCEIAPNVGTELEDNPAVIQELISHWQLLEPIGIYFSLTRRSITVIVEADDEAALFGPLHATWRATNSYPDVNAVVGISEFPGMLKSVGIG